MWRRITALTVAALLTGAVGVSAQIYTPESLERYFRLEWEVTRGRKGPKVEGYVYNQAMRTAEHMRLQIERLDASAKVVGSSTVWVFGTVRVDGRAYFSASVPDAASYRVQVLSFDWTCDGGGGGGGLERSTVLARGLRQQTGGERPPARIFAGTGPARPSGARGRLRPPPPP